MGCQRDHIIINLLPIYSHDCYWFFLYKIIKYSWNIWSGNQIFTKKKRSSNYIIKKAMRRLWKVKSFAGRTDLIWFAIVYVVKVLIFLNVCFELIKIWFSYVSDVSFPKTPRVVRTEIGYHYIVICKTMFGQNFYSISFFI